MQLCLNIFLKFLITACFLLRLLFLKLSGIHCSADCNATMIRKMRSYRFEKRWERDKLVESDELHFY